MAKKKIQESSPYLPHRALSELFAVDDSDISRSADEKKNRDYVKEIVDELNSSDPKQLEEEGLELVPGETMIGEKNGYIKGEFRELRIYYGNFVRPMIADTFITLKRKEYLKMLEDFLASEEGSRYRKPAEDEIEKAFQEVKEVEEAIMRRQELLRTSAIIQPPQDLSAAKEPPKEEVTEEKKEPVEDQEENAPFKDDVPSEEARAVEYIRNKNYTRQQIREIRRGLDAEKSRSTLATAAFVLLALAILAVSVFLIRDLIIRAHALIELELKTGQITIRAGDPFSPGDYVKYVTEDESVYVIYPSLDTKDVGEHRLDYVATNGIRNVRKTLIATVIDGESPMIVLSDEEIMLVRGRDEESFDPLSYIREMSDNLDEDLEAEVSPLDWSKDETSLTYRVKDSSGNIGRAILLVKIEDRAVCDKNAIYNSTTNTCRCKSGYTGDGSACQLVQSSSSPAETAGGNQESGSNSTSGSSGSSSSSSSSSSTTTSESWTIDYENYQPSNGENEVTYTNNETGESYTVSGGSSDPYESDEELWNEIDNLGG